MKRGIVATVHNPDCSKRNLAEIFNMKRANMEIAQNQSSKQKKTTIAEIFNIKGANMEIAQNQSSKQKKTTSESEPLVVALPSQLPPANAEQMNIIESIHEGNVSVDAVAGSGKTTLSLKMAEKYPSKKLLLLTFNAKLKSETRRRTKDVGLTNLEAHSFHAFGVKYYCDTCIRDEDLSAIVLQNMEPKRKSTFDIIILDESQDLKPLFYQYVLKIFQDFARPSQTKLCILGDVFQMVYEVFGADARFLQHSPQCFPLNQAPWLSRPMHTTYRLTRSMVHFLNRCVIGQERLFSTKSHDEKVDLFEISWNKDGMTNELANLWNNLMQRGYKDGEIMILSPSVKSPKIGHPVNRFIHYLTNRGHQIFVDQSHDDYSATEDETTNKILFTNFVKAKGLERKLVVVLYFDRHYFDFYAKNLSPQTVTNAMYVALTRAKEKLVLVKDTRSEHLPFLNLKVLMSPSMLPFVTVHQSAAKVHSSSVSNEQEIIKCDVTDLCDLPNLHMYHDELTALVHFKLTSRKVGCRKDEGTILDAGKEYNYDKDITEDTSRINGIAIPLFYAMKHCPLAGNYKQSIKEALNEMRRCIKTDKGQQLSAQLSNMVAIMDESERLCDITADPKKVLLIASLIQSWHGHLYHPLLQLPQSFAWLSSACFIAGENRLCNILRDQTSHIFEENVSLECTSNSGNRYIISGIIDCITDKCIYEFKCTSEITFTHKLQTALYAIMQWQHMSEVADSHRLSVKLFNINTNECWVLSSEENQLWQALQLLLRAKENPLKPISTTNFFIECQRSLTKAGVSCEMKKDGSTRGYPIVYFTDETEPDEDDEIQFDKLLDNEQARIHESYREPEHVRIPSYDKWRPLLDQREKGRIKTSVKIIEGRIDALGVNTDASLMFYDGIFSAPLIQGFGDSLACAQCSSKLSKTENEYISRPQRIYCTHCQITVAEKHEISRKEHPYSNQAPLLSIPGKREFLFIHATFPWQQKLPAT